VSRGAPAASAAAQDPEESASKDGPAEHADLIRMVRDVTRRPEPEVVRALQKSNWDSGAAIMELLQ
jgi:NACalpha-BTF3-like transcription factor